MALDWTGQMPKTIFTGSNQVVVEIIRKARLDAGLTQAQLASLIERDQSHLSLIEGSQRRLDLVEFVRIARALRRDPVALFSEIVSAMRAPPSAVGPSTLYKLRHGQHHRTSHAPNNRVYLTPYTANFLPLSGNGVTSSAGGLK
jgi:transcriptional regulator with XRE-family HTH domain